MSQSGAPQPPSPSAIAGLPVALPVSAGAAPAKAGVGRARPPALAADDGLPPPPNDGDYLSAAPAWLFSAIIHMVLMIILGLVFVANEGVPRFILSLSMEDTGGEDFRAGDVDMPIDLSDPVVESGDVFEPVQIASSDPTTEMAAAPAPVSPLGIVETSDIPPMQLALRGRQAGMKNSLLRAYGGSSSTETAVTEALRWLARNQGDKGMWSLAGKYSDGARDDNPEAATAMALLAFQGAGITPDSGKSSPFTPTVAKGWTALLKRQDEQGNFFHEGGGTTRLYTQALCTIALCELYGMTKDSQYRDAAQLAVDYCVKVQAPEGGWRYQPGFDSDTSVTGWFVMALQSARMAGLDVPSPTLHRVGEFLDTVALDGGAQYAYTPGQGKKNSMTAEGLLCRQYLGWKQNDKRLQRGVNTLLEDLPSVESGKTHVYYWYYASQVCHHMEGEAWRKWNAAMRETLPTLQVREGKERGSWDPNVDETVGISGGGRLFVTCLSTYMLEVYYRHLPIYQLDVLSGGAGSLSADMPPEENLADEPAE
jgi:hypothetical protein